MNYDQIWIISVYACGCWSNLIFILYSDPKKIQKLMWKFWHGTTFEKYNISSLKGSSSANLVVSGELISHCIVVLVMRLDTLLWGVLLNLLGRHDLYLYRVLWLSGLSIPIICLCIVSTTSLPAWATLVCHKLLRHASFSRFIFALPVLWGLYSWNHSPFTSVVENVIFFILSLWMSFSSVPSSTLVMIVNPRCLLLYCCTTVVRDTIVPLISLRKSVSNIVTIPSFDRHASKPRHVYTIDMASTLTPYIEYDYMSS